MSFLILVAAWCSSPVYMRLSSDEVDKCRIEALKCEKYTLNKTEMNNCFLKIKLDR